MEKMQYVNLGNSGIKVSRFGYGNFVNSGRQDAQELSNKLIKAAFDLGINFFDTAEVYGEGEAERQLGVALKHLNVPRSDYVLTTKLFTGGQPGNKNLQNLRGTSRKRIIEGLDRSLAHLNQPYVDIIYCHRFDHTTTVLEVCQAMKTVIDAGKAFHWGTSEWPAVRIMEAIHISDKIGGYRPIVDQCQYNLLERKKVEGEFVELFDDYKFGTTIWSPLASGILTGKYNNGIPEGSRFDVNKSAFVAGYLNLWLGEKVREKNVKKLNELAAIATQIGATLGQLALAWAIKNKDVHVCILGASNESQLKENIAAFDFVSKITAEIEKKIEDILENAPEQQTNFLTWKPLPGRRQ